MLLLVELVPLDLGVRGSESVDGPTHLTQDLRTLDVDDLGPDDGRIRAVGLFHQHPHGAGVAHRIRVQNNRKGAPATVPRASFAAAETVPTGTERTNASGQCLRHPRRQVGFRRGNDEDGEVGIVGVGEGPEAGLEVGCLVPSDDHGHDRGNRRGGLVVSLVGEREVGQARI